MEGRGGVVKMAGEAVCWVVRLMVEVAAVGG